jgi:hypothetical protein
MNETNNTVIVKDPFVMLASLMQTINEAKRSGTTYRPEHGGFDFAIYEASIRPQIAELKNLRLYSDNGAFKQCVDILENYCNYEVE